MDREFVERVKEAVDITQLMADRGIRLTRSGRRLKALCPFHEEKTPSFYVEPDLGLYHCFGCGASGDAIKFVMEMEGLSFPEAVRFLAERFGVPVPAESASRERPQALDALEFAVGFYHEKLFSDEGKRAMEYLVGRGLAPETIREFTLGYAPGGNALMKAAHEKGLGVDALAAGGLVIRSGAGDWFDFFRGRILFPVFSASGRNPLGFSGRALGDEEPKYLNTRETSFFKKGELLYGLHLARKEIRKSGEVIVAEGNMDVLALHQAGFKNSVAPLGTAFTPSQAKVIAKYGKKLVIMFDGDKPGQAAARRSLPHLVAAGLLVRVASLPQGEDPASLASAGRTADLERAKLNSRDWVAFLREFYDDSQEGKRGFETELLEVISGLPPEDAELYLNRAKTLLEYSDDWVRGVKQRMVDRAFKKAKEKPRGENISHKEFFLMVHAIAHGDEQPFASGLSLVRAEALTHPLAKKLAELHAEGHDINDVAREDPELGKAISEILLGDHEAHQEDIRASFTMLVFELRDRELSRRLREAESQGDRRASEVIMAKRSLNRRVMMILRRMQEAKPFRYPERRDAVLETLSGLQDRIQEIWDAPEALLESFAEIRREMDRLDSMINGINDPRAGELFNRENKGAHAHGK